MRSEMKLRLLMVALLSFYCSFASANESILFDVKSFCRMPIEEAKINLPVDIKHFNIEERDSIKYGHEETWTLTNNSKLKPLELKVIKIEIHQDIVQMVWFIDIGSVKNRPAIRSKNLSRAGLHASELKKVMSEYRVNGNRGLIRILGENHGYFECFEYHAGH